MNCPFCGGKASYFLTKNNIPVYRCRECGLAFAVGEFPRLDSIYDANYYKHHANRYLKMTPAEEAIHNRRLHAMNSHIASPGKLLDVGCATGHFLHLATQQGWEVSGLELSQFSAEQARKQYGLDVQIGTLETHRFPESFFEAITMWDVLEHVPDPVKTFAEVSRILKPGGIFAFSTVNIASINARLQKEKWRYLDPPEHLYYFTPGVLKKMLKDTGFSICYRKSIYALHAALESMGTDQARQEKFFHFAKKYLKPFKRVRDALLWLFPLGDVIEVIAREE